MRLAFRLLVGGLSGLAGIAAILLVMQPALVAAPRSWLLAAVSAMLAGTLISTALTMISAASLPLAADPSVDAGREIHAEAAKIITQLRALVEASGNFHTVLARANEQLPDALKPEQVRLVISYLMIENENMRRRTADLQANLERSQRQVESLKSTLAVSEEQGVSDALTGLRNRRGFDITLAAEIAGARSSGKPLSLIFADIDFFKQVNDRHGHQAGDDALKWFARILSSNMKGRDTVARYGGEEFAIILPQTTLENATLLAGQIRQQLQSQLWCKPGAPNTSMRITASFGVAQLADGEGTSGLQQRADKKLYESKTGGRNRIAA